jgi:type 2 lantibiotic biosynthesis protein LanM
MNQSRFQSSSWYHAVTLSERIASLQRIEYAAASENIGSDATRRTFDLWRSQPPFKTASYFDQRLAMDSITENEFMYLLGEPIEAVRARFPDTPEWLITLAQAFSKPGECGSKLPAERYSGDEMAQLLSAIEPLIRRGVRCVQERLEKLGETCIDLSLDLSALETALFTSLAGQLIPLISRTIVLELNIARLQGRLPGDTSEERFENFVRSLTDHGLDILQEYPVLARQLVVRIDQWISFRLEFLEHLCADWEAIRITFSPEANPGALLHVEAVGDRHRDGRAVLIVRFSSGFHLVYKPRPLAIDVHFQRLLAWVNDRGDHPPFRTIKTLDRLTYGWSEFVPRQDCRSCEEVRRFYERQGGYVALLHALQGTDFHSENIIAMGEHPILIDLEALFHPCIVETDAKYPDQLAISALNASVIATGLLPQNRWEDTESDGIDFSGLGGMEGQLTPFVVPHWEKVGTDEMRLIYKQAMLPGDENRPRLNDDEVDAVDYADALLHGFTNIYRLLIKHRDDLLSDECPLAAFADDQVRVIIRATQSYSFLLHASYHPDMLRNALDRDRLFDRLWGGIEDSPYLAKVIAAEREALQVGDIPMFTTRPASCDLWSVSGERIPDFFGEPGLIAAKRRIQGLSEKDLAQQLWFIQGSLATLRKASDRIQWPSYHLTEREIVASRERLLFAAQTAADRLEALALRREHDVSWIGLRAANERCWSFTPLGPDLYDGLSGIALFLGYLGEVTQQERYVVLAHAAAETLRRQTEYSRSFITTIGAFSGWGGVIYTLAHLATLWGQATLISDAEEIVSWLPALIDRDEAFDIVSGAAGCIGSLISLYRCSPSSRTLSRAVQCGDRLIADSHRRWTVTPGRKPLTGFSHGAAGMAWALLELAAVTGEKRFQVAALDAIAYERSLFSPEAGNWPDLRDCPNPDRPNEKKFTFTTAWCHGAPGIGLGRLCSLQHIEDATARAEVAIALKTTLAEGFGSNHSLCHGDLGNLELPLQASERLDDPRCRAHVEKLAAMILESIDQHGWLCGVPLKAENPGLMTGIAGIGYGLLRLAESTRIPSVLVLQAPARK